ncbi:MAG: FAD-dependent oxidoreductase [bacterium]|nr:FAD-dependent oxidoreductase [bacterium]
MTKYVILGAVAAGSKAAMKIKRLDPKSEVVIYTKDTHVSYSACGFPYFIASYFNDENLLYARSVDDFLDLGIEVHLLSKCEKILPNDKIVIISDLLTGNTFEIKFDKLLIATGADAILPKNISGLNLDNVFKLRNVEDAILIKNKIETSNSSTIIGGGYIGIELAEAFLSKGLKVNLVEANSTILSIFDDDISNIVRTFIESNYADKISIFTDEKVVSITNDNWLNVETESGLVFNSDFVIVCVGVFPNVEFARQSGIELGITGAIKVNSNLQTNFEDIYAAGDCAEKFHIVSNTHCWIPLGSTATKEGRIAAINMCGGNEKFDGVLGSTVTKFFDYTISMTGLTEKSAKNFGFSPVSSMVKKKDKVSYMPEAKDIILKLVADKDSRKLLGVQVVGLGDADKRTNSVVSALVCGSKVDDFVSNDLTYSPAFSPSIDALLNAAVILQGELNN